MDPIGGAVERRQAAQVHCLLLLEHMVYLQFLVIAATSAGAALLEVVLLRQRTVGRLRLSLVWLTIHVKHSLKDNKNISLLANTEQQEPLILHPATKFFTHTHKTPQMSHLNR